MLDEGVDPVAAGCGDADRGLTVAVAGKEEPSVGIEGVGVSGVIGISDIVGVKGFSEMVGDDVTDEEGPTEGVAGDPELGIGVDWVPALGVVGEPETNVVGKLDAGIDGVPEAAVLGEPGCGVVGLPVTGSAVEPVFGDVEEPSTVEPDMGVLPVPEETVDCIPGWDVVNIGETVEPGVTVVGIGVVGVIVEPGYA